MRMGSLSSKVSCEFCFLVFCFFVFLRLFVLKGENANDVVSG